VVGREGIINHSGSALTHACVCSCNLPVIASAIIKPGRMERIGWMDGINDAVDLDVDALCLVVAGLPAWHRTAGLYM
jgi:hypothetical protein